LWLVWLVWLVFLHWISPRKPTQAITDENLGYRFYVVPCFEASTQEEAKEKRLLVETLRLTVDVDEETLETLATFFFFRLS